MPREVQQPPAVLEYAVEAEPRSHWLLSAFRIGAFVGLLGWGYYIAVTFRCWRAGLSLHGTLLVTVMFVGPWALAAFLGMRWRRYLVVVAVLIVLPALIAETQATLEERLFVASVKDLPPSAPVVFKSRRWWPAESSYLYYVPATGQLGGGD